MVTGENYIHWCAVLMRSLSPLFKIKTYCKLYLLALLQTKWFYCRTMTQYVQSTFKKFLSPHTCIHIYVYLCIVVYIYLLVYFSWRTIVLWPSHGHTSYMASTWSVVFVGWLHLSNLCSPIFYIVIGNVKWRKTERKGKCREKSRMASKNFIVVFIIEVQVQISIINITVHIHLNTKSTTNYLSKIYIHI